jgi:hypothetical protein
VRLLPIPIGHYEKQIVTLSWWNHHFFYSADVPLERAVALERLANLYRQRAHKQLVIDSESGTLLVERGSLWASFLAIGPETWCRHMVQVKATESAGGTRLEFEMTLKLVGVTLGRNFLVDDCAAISAAIAGA